VILLLFLALQIPARVPERYGPARWIEAPLPHWHCPAGAGIFNLDDYPKGEVPGCTKFDGPKLQLAYDPKTQEEIPFTFAREIPQSGELRVEFLAGFVKMPGCKITGDETRHIRVREETKDHLLIEGAPGQTLHFDCHGIVARGDHGE
jgi:hypothetical protein